ncbi:MAG: hypothetical protein AAF899_05125 [Pseudomonadota bacterium]
MTALRPSYPFLRSYLFYLFGVFIVATCIVLSITIASVEFSEWHLLDIGYLWWLFMISFVMAIPATTVILPPIVTLILLIQPPGIVEFFGFDVIGYGMFLAFLVPSSWLFLISICFLAVKRRLWMLWREWTLAIAVAAAIPVLAALAVRTVGT